MSPLLEWSRHTYTMLHSEDRKHFCIARCLKPLVPKNTTCLYEYNLKSLYPYLIPIFYQIRNFTTNSSNMPIVTVPTSFNIDLEFDAPGLGRRTVALLIDMTVQCLYLIFTFYWIDDQFGVQGLDNWAISLLAMCPVFLYHISWELFTNGQSIGKKVMKLRVVSLNGGRPSLGQLLIRWLLRVSDLWIMLLFLLIISVLGGDGDTEALIVLVFGMGFLITDIVLASNGKKPQRIGDLLAQTILIKTSTRESLDNTIFTEVEENYEPMFPQVMRISDRDLNIIKSLLNGKNHTELAAAAEKVKDFLQIDTHLYPDEFLERLLKDYNYLSAR